MFTKFVVVLYSFFMLAIQINSEPLTLADNTTIMNDSMSGFTRDRAYTTATSNPTRLPLLDQSNSQQMESGSQHHRLNFEFSLEDYIKKTKKAANFLKLLLHCQKCDGSCSSISCYRTMDIMRHANQCYSVNCVHQGCTTTKKLLFHHRECCLGKNPIDSFSIPPSAFSGSQTNNISVDSTSSSSSSSSTSIIGQYNFLRAVSVNTTSNNMPTHFCLLCTLATNENNARSGSRQPSTDSEGVYSFHFERYIENSEEDHRFAPLISDEIIEFSRVPFQSYHSHHEESMFTHGEDGYGLSEMSHKKMRSKSMSAASNTDAMILTHN